MSEQIDGVVSVTDTYEGLVEACVVRRHELGLSQLLVDEVAGLPSGYCAKLEVGMKRMGAMSLPVLLKTLGLQLVVTRVEPPRRWKVPAPIATRSQLTHSPRAA